MRYRPSLSRATLTRAFLILPLIVLSGSALLLAEAPVLAEVPLAVQIVTAHLASRSSDDVLAFTLEAKDSVPTSFRDGGRLVLFAPLHALHLCAWPFWCWNWALWPWACRGLVARLIWTFRPNSPTCTPSSTWPPIPKPT